MIEIEILKYFQSIRTESLDKVFEFITMIGEETIMIILIAVLYFAFNKNFAQRLLFVSVASLSVNGILKNIVKMPRPFAKGEITCVRPDTATGYSFPSGHTQTFATSSTVIAQQFKKIWLTIITAFFILLVALSRMYLGAHYPSDVIVGAILGVVIALVGCNIYDKTKNKTKLYFITTLILTPFAIYFLIQADPLFEDFFKIYGMIIGFLLGVMCEEKYAPLEYNVAWWKKVIRVIIAVIIAYVIKEGIKMFDVFGITQISLALDAIRYLVLIFVVFGLYPVFIKKVKI